MDAPVKPGHDNEEVRHLAGSTTESAKPGQPWVKPGHDNEEVRHLACSSTETAKPDRRGLERLQGFRVSGSSGGTTENGMHWSPTSLTRSSASRNSG
jgi:hypothetical protein